MKYMSIVIPVYNAEKTIERTLASLISNKDFIKEVILVDDRSYDKTFSKIDNFKTFFDIKIINNEGKDGPGPARKTGILAATGEWIVFVDADDCLTANSLYYVDKKIQENPEMVLLHTQTIYYESGNFNPEHIAYAINSCGGNIYKRDYLIKHNIFPHNTLFMSEDEYFNDILIQHIKLKESSNISLIEYFEYPVYEVHHDDYLKSFAHSNWVDYVCKYHLLYKQYVVEFFEKEIQQQLYNYWIDGFIFCYMMLQDIANSKELEVNYKEIFNDFKQALDFYKKTFNKTAEDLIKYYRNHPQQIANIKAGVECSTGAEYKEILPFRHFIRIINK